LNHQNLAIAVYRHACAQPEAPAVAFQGKTLTYASLAEHSARLASYLSTNFNPGLAGGQADGDVQAPVRAPRVGILASRSPQACIAVLGTCWAGATYVPIGLKQPESRILALLEQCELSAVITDDEGARCLSQQLLDACPQLIIHAGDQPPPPGVNSNRIIHLQTLASVLPHEPIEVAASHTAYIIFTSGTTGMPKGVMISAGSARHYIGNITRWLDLRADDRTLESCELSFDFSVHNMFSTWEAGACLHILPASQTMNAVRFAREAQLTVWNSVPALAGLLRQVGALKAGSMASLRKTVFGGEPLTETLAEQWRLAAPNSEVANLYGPTEATVFCLAQKTEAPNAFSPDRRIAAIGTALPGVEAGVITPEGQFVESPATGELVIAGQQLAQQYLGLPVLTQARFPTLGAKRWYRTGDLAFQDASGVFHCLGRIDHQIKLLGYRVELEEIEAHLRAVSGIELVAAVPWPIENGSPTGIVGFVSAPSVDAQRIIASLRTRIPPHMVPRRIISVQTMPINGSGKVDRQALKHLLEQPPS
jgi:D-alanine--poly(phosphoribitol) ligase subunit 1